MSRTTDLPAMLVSFLSACHSPTASGRRSNRVRQVRYPTAAGRRIILGTDLLSRVITEGLWTTTRPAPQTLDLEMAPGGHSSPSIVATEGADPAYHAEFRPMPGFFFTPARGAVDVMFCGYPGSLRCMALAAS